MESKKISDTKIAPLQTIKKNKREVILDILPDSKSDRPFWMIVSARVGSGKSVLIANLLKQKNMYYKIFDKVYFCSINIKDGEIFDSSYDGIRFNKSRMYDDFNDEVMEQIIADIHTDSDFKENAYLLVIDDLGPNMQHINKSLLKKFLSHRHHRLSIIICAQNIKLFNPKIRANCSHLIAFYNDNKHERNALSEMCNMDPDTFNELLDFATQEPYHFLYISLLTPRKLKAYKNFSEEIVF